MQIAPDFFAIEDVRLEPHGTLEVTFVGVRAGPTIDVNRTYAAIPGVGAFRVNEVRISRAA
jgi:hypothetical protein